MAHPPRLTLAGLLLGFLLLVAPSEANQCRTGCHGIHSSQAYQVGRTYTYQLDGQSVTSVTGAEEEGTLRLNAIVELFIKPDCAHQIRLKNVKINGASASQGEIERHALQFNYHNGHIDTEVCAEAGDTQASLNVKRAVISLFQDAIVQDDGGTTHSETDVFGGCPTDFTFSKNGESQTIKKYRNLEQCLYRENVKQDLISATFNSNSDIKSTPLLAAELKIEQQFNRGVLNKASSVETYKYRPFTNAEAGAKTVVETTLTFRGESSASNPATVSEPKSLIFEAPHQVVRSSVEAITKALQACKESMPDAVTIFSARRFAELIKVLRLSSSGDILTVYSRVKAGAGFEKESARKVLLDALFRTGTGEATEAIVALIKNREISQFETIIYYTSLPFVRHASLSSVTAVATLLDQSGLPRIGYLGIGALIGKYCQEHKCENVPEVNAALAKISSKLIKANTREQEDSVISALKGLGNARYLDDATLIKIADIAADKTVHNRVRIAALEALPTRCSMKWKERVFSTFADHNEDSEIRIKTYLSLVACPCTHVASKLKEVLDKETINQVGAFITSHLRNLRASTNPDKEQAKHQLGLIKPRTKFPEDFRKFSFNNELSYTIDAFGMGSSLESNVIYSQNSFVPRSASLNLTTEIFGRSMNFLELNGRAENCDTLIEKYLGPKGVLRSSNLKTAFLDGRKTYDEIVEEIKNRFQKKLGRHARQVSQTEIDNFSKRIHLPDTELNDDLELDLSIKIFGAELAFLSYQGGKNKLTPSSIVDKILDIFETGVDKAKNFDYHFKNHLHFLDAELVYPTGLGFPLTLGVTGTSAVHLKTKGKIDFPAIYKNPQSTAIQIAIEPSASIRIAGSLIVDGYGIESGLKVITTLHTATGTDLSLKLLEGNGVDINLGIPKQKQELITVTSEVLISSAAKGDYEPATFSKGKEHADCFEQLSNIIGLSVCGKVSYPYDSVASIQRKPAFPLSGPATFSIYLVNNDVRNYHFKVYYNAANPNARSFEILLETPNSRTNRRISIIAEGALEPDKLLRVNFDSPWKKASAEGIIKNNANEHTLTITVHHDTIEYFVRAGIVSSGNKYRPVLEYKVPDHVEKLAGVKNGVKNTKRNGQAFTTGGIIEINNYNGGKKYTLNQVTLASGNQALISIDGNVAVTSSGGNTDLKVDYGGDTYSINGNTVLTNPFNYKSDLSVVPAKNTAHGFSVSVESKGSNVAGEQSLVVVFGDDLNSQTNRLSYYGKHKVNYASPQDFELSIERKITYPALGLVVHVEGGVNPKYIGYDVELKYAKFNLESELSAKTGISKPGDFEIEFDAKLQANSIDFKTKRKILDEHKNKFETSLELQPGGKYELDAVVDYNVKPETINTHLDAELKVNGKKITIDVGLESNPSKVNSRAVINYESAKYVDFVLILQRGNNPNGNFKLNLKNYFTSNGKFQYQKGSTGDGQIEINIPKFNRKITGHGEVSVTGTKHVATIEILYDATKDPKKRLKLSTDSDFTPTSFDTKNTLEILDYKTVVNAKGTTQGQIDNGRQNAEFEITLPNGRYIVGKGSRTVTTENELIDGQMQLELIDHVTKGGKSRKLVYHPEVHNLNVKEYTFRAKHDLQLINFEGEDVHLIFAAKNLPDGPNKKSTEVQFDLSGSKIPSPFTFQSGYDRENDGAYSSGKLRTALGNNLSLQVNGNFVRGNNVDKPSTMESVIEIKLPSEKLSSLKLEVSDTILIPNEAGGRFEFIEKSQLTYNNDKTIKLDSHFTNSGIPDKSHIVEGTGKVTITVLSNAPVTVGYNYKHNPLKELKETSAGLNLNFGNKQTSISMDSAYTKRLDVCNINIKATTPIEKIRNVDIKLQHKGTYSGDDSKIPRSGETDITLIFDQVKYTLDSEYELSEQKYHSHTITTSPDGRVETTVKVNKIGPKEFTGEFKFNSPQGFVNTDGHINAASIEDFSVIVNFDSNKVQKLHAEVTNKATAKAGKRIIVSVTSAGKNIVTGSTNYKKHTEGNKVIVEGNGSLKIREDTRSSSFKYTHQQLTGDVDGETGPAILLNFNFGQSSIVGEFKLTEKEIHILNSYCEQSADCAQFNLQSKINSAGFKRTQEVILEIDLRKYNVPYEFGLKSNQVADAETGFDHTTTLYLHSSKEKSQYSFKTYGHPTESGIVLTLPSRELALIGTVDIPTNKRSGSYKLDISSWMDRKRRPKEKTSLTFTGDVTIDKNTGSLSGETRFTYPSRPKDLIVKGQVHLGGAHLLDGNLDIDVFENRNQKIVIDAKLLKNPINQGYNVTGTLSVVSQGQQLNVGLDQHLTFSRGQIGFGSLLSYTDKQRRPKSTGILFSANPQEAHLLIYSPDQQLIKADSTIDLAKNAQKVHTDVTVLGRDPVVIIFEVKDLSSFKYIYQTKNNPNNKLEASGRFVAGQVAEVRADAMKDGRKRELFNVLLHLDERRYLKPDFTFNKDNIARVIDAYRTSAVEFVKQANEFLKAVSEELVDELKDLLDHLKKAVPNLKPLFDHYVTQLDQLKNELNIETEGFKQAREKLNAIFAGPIAAITDGLKKLHAHYEEINKTFNDFIERLSAAFKKTLPELQKSAKAINTAVTEILEDVVAIVTAHIKTLVEIFNAHKDEFKQIAIVSSDLIRDVSSILLKSITKIQGEVSEFFTVLVTELKALPIYEIIQKKYQELLNLNVSNIVIRTINDVVESINRFMPTKALEELLTSLQAYIVSHIKQEKVDDIQELKKLWSNILRAVQSLIELARSSATTNDYIDIFQSRIPYDFSALAKLPGIATLKVSILSLLRNQELPTIADVFYAYRPTLNPSDLIPPFSKFGVFADGGHFFTFDGRHLTYPGKCNYILAQDARDGNFSIVAEFRDGKLISVTLTEPKDSITIQSTGAVLVNNVPAEFPVTTKNLHAYVHSRNVDIWSDYGVRLDCIRKSPLICGVHISGFYHGRLRGILGNGNNEPSDDFMLPSGEVTENQSDFGNAFKLGGQCPAVQATRHHTSQPSPICKEFFSGSSPLRRCFNFVDPTHYREGCEHSASAGAQKEGACLIAVAYYAVCREAGIFVNIPPTCGSCQVGNQKIDIGNTFSVQHPKQQADVVFVLEQATENNRIFHELIVPLITIIKSELKDNGVIDVHIGLIGFGDKLDVPQHYTTKGSLNIDGDVKNIKFTDRKPTITYQEAKNGDLKKRLEFLGQKLEVEVGTFKLIDAYEEALYYDFRPGASKTIIGVIATPCEKSPLPISLQHIRLLLGHKIYNDLGLTYHQIAPLDDILISGKALKNVVGFDSDSVFVLGDSKKKPMEGSAEHKANMVLASHDVCAEFAAASGGAAFSAHNFLEAKPNQKKQFLQVTGRRVVSSLVNTEIREDCVCTQQFGAFSKAECKIVSRKDKEPIGRPTKGGVKG